MYVCVIKKYLIKRKIFSSVIIIVIPTVIDFSPEVNIGDPVFGTSNVTVDITIQLNEHRNVKSSVSLLVMYNISFSSTTESEVEGYNIQNSYSFTFKAIVPYNVYMCKST